MNYTDVILGNDKALKKDGIRSLLIGVIVLFMMVVFFIFTQRISILGLVASILSIFIGISKLRAVGACKIELMDTEFTVTKRGIMGTSTQTYEKSKVENIKILEAKKLKKLNQTLSFEDQQFSVQFAYEKRFAMFTSQQFIQVGQKFSKYFNCPINENK